METNDIVKDLIGLAESSIVKDVYISTHLIDAANEILRLREEIFNLREELQIMFQTYEDILRS